LCHNQTYAVQQTALRPGAFEDAIDVPCRLAELFGVIVTIGDQTT